MPGLSPRQRHMPRWGNLSALVWRLFKLALDRYAINFSVIPDCSGPCIVKLRKEIE